MTNVNGIRAVPRGGTEKRARKHDEVNNRFTQI
jgi:hypothetical protein